LLLFFFGCFFPVSEISAGIKSSKLQIAWPMWPPPNPTPHPQPPILTFSHSIKEEKPVHIVSKWMKKVSHPKRQRMKNDHNMLFIHNFIFSTPRVNYQSNSTKLTPHI
jgi:hypothetical protein